MVKVLVSSGEDPDQSVTPVRLSSYLSVSTEGSDQSTPAIDSTLEAPAVPPDPKTKSGEVRFPDIPLFGFENDENDSVIELSSNPPAKPVLKPIEGT